MADPISIVYSGGVSNFNPDESLGGPPSPTPIGSETNNLFADVSGDEVTTGLIDYRCFYIFNDSTDDDYANFKVWIDSQTEEGSNCQIGIVSANEIQTLTFVNVQSGTFALKLDGHTTDLITFDFDPSTLAQNIQDGLRGLPNSRTCEVTSLSSVAFQVEWAGLEGNKQYPLMILETNLLSPGDPLQPANILIEETQIGSPINATTTDVAAPTDVPFGVEFVTTSRESPIEVGLLKPTEGFAVWVRRIVDSEAAALEEDGFVFKAAGDQVPGGLNA